MIKENKPVVSQDNVVETKPVTKLGIVGNDSTIELKLLTILLNIPSTIGDGESVKFLI